MVVSRKGYVPGFQAKYAGRVMADDSNLGDQDIAWLHQKEPGLKDLDPYILEDIEYQFVEDVDKIWDQGELSIEQVRIAALTNLRGRMRDSG